MKIICEEWPKFKEDAWQLMLAHWAELTEGKEGQLDPNWPLYQQNFVADSLLSMSAREDGEMVGYIVGLLARHPRKRTTLMMVVDAYYVIPEFRSKGVATELFTCFATMSKLKGASRIYAGTRAKSNVHKLLEKLEYTEQERYYMKVL